MQRLPGAVPGNKAILRQHSLCFRNSIQGESGKCDIDFSGNPEDFVYGVIYQMNLTEKAILDGYETGGFGYLDKSVEVVTLSGEPIKAFTYYAAEDHGMRPPFHWYKQHLLRGAIELGFPADYIAAIEAVKSIDDPDVERTRRELAIYT